MTTMRLSAVRLNRLLLAFILVLGGTCAFAVGGTPPLFCIPSPSSGTIIAAINSLIGGVSSFEFFKTINDFLGNEIDYFQWTLLTSTAQFIGGICLTLLTIWIMYQGFRVATGRIHVPMIALLGDSLKAALIISVATAAATGASATYWTLTDGMVTNVNKLVNPGSSSPYADIDNNLAKMEIMMLVIDTLSSGASAATGTTTDSEVQSASTRAKWFSGIGIAGPSVVGGAVLLLNKIAIALFVGLGPLFIMCLLFEQTKSLFQRWLLYGLGTVFSLAVLAFMVTLSTKMVTAVTAAILLQYAAQLLTCTPPSGANSITSMAMQQGGLGLILSVLIVSAPPMAAAFFQGTLGQFMSYSAFGHVGDRGSAGYADAAARGGSAPVSSAAAPRALPSGSSTSEITPALDGYATRALAGPPSSSDTAAIPTKKLNVSGESV